MSLPSVPLIVVVSVVTPSGTGAACPKALSIAKMPSSNAAT